MEGWREAVEKVMRENGINDPMVLIAGLLDALRQNHQFFSGNPAYNDGMGGAIQMPTRCVADSVKNLMAMSYSLYKNNAEAHRKAGQDQSAEPMEALGRIQKALYDLLEYYKPIWNADVSDMNQASRMLAIQKGWNRPTNPPQPPTDPAR